MLDKTPGAVCCAHCRRLGAEQVCPFCDRPVCADCLARDSCPIPHPRELRLGVGARLRAVDEAGERGLVTGWSGRNRVVDLRNGEALLDWNWPESMPYTGADAPPPCPLGPHRVAWVPHPSELSPELAIGDLRYATVEYWRPRRFPRYRPAAATADGRYVLLRRADEKVTVLDLQRGKRGVTISIKRQAVHSVAADGALDLVAVGTYGKATFYRLTDGASLGSRQTGEGDVDWIGLAAGRAALFSGEAIYVLEVDLDLPPFKWRMIQSARADWPEHGSLSPDGELLALRDGDRQVLVLGVSSGRVQPLKRHTDSVNFVRFVRNGQLLVTADDDNRVMFWPREGDGVVADDD